MLPLSFTKTLDLFVVLKRSDKATGTNCHCIGNVGFILCHWHAQGKGNEMLVPVFKLSSSQPYGLNSDFQVL